ncbi:MAG: sugar phosphate isomerase/epimerase [Verrucomicrobia bacterium]|nr:sugar phosphate isomerase/epimerase [Verrucomicrobiota bacterium]
MNNNSGQTNNAPRISRRDFVKTATTVTGGLLLAGYSVERHALAIGAPPRQKDEGGSSSAPLFNERIAVNVTGCFAGREVYSALETARKLGFQSVAALPGGKPKHSLGELPTLGFYDADETGRQRIKKALSRFKHISIHQAWDNKWRDWIDCACYVGAEVVTIHAPLRKRAEPLDQYLETQARFCREVGDYAQRKGVRIGVENSAGCYDDYVRLMKAIKHPVMGATVDVGHCSFFDEVKSISDPNQRAVKLNDVIGQLVRDLGPRLCHFHLHNVRRQEQVDFSKMANRRWEPGSFVDHRCVPEGEIDFPRLFAAIKEVDYRGLFELELEELQMEEKAVRSAEYLGMLLKQGKRLP